MISPWRSCATACPGLVQVHLAAMLLFAVMLARGAWAAEPGIATNGGGTLRARVDEPYRIVVVLRFSDDPTFTRFFAESVRREIRDQLANSFERLAEVQVVAEHPLLDKLEATSVADLTEFPATLAVQESLDKLFWVTIDGDGGSYRLQWRQVDFEVQQVGALHARSTPDRQWLAKAICLAIQEDFAPVALVEATDGSQKVRLRFHGVQRSAKLKAWLDGGCVLQPLWAVRGKDGRLAHTPIPHTILSIPKGQDATEAEVVSGRANPWKRTARVAGFRAIKLTTQTGRFRLRLVNSQTGAPALSCTVAANSRGFEFLGDRDRLPFPDPDGCVVADRSFDHLAYVTISQGKSAIHRLLLPITSDWWELDYQVSVEPQAEAKSDWHRRLRYRVQDVQVIQSLLDQSIREVNALNQEKRYEEALQKLKAATSQLQPLVDAAQKGIAGLETQSQTLDLSQNPLLAWAREQVQEVQQRQKELGKLEEELQATIRDVDARNRAKVLVRLAAQAESAGNFDDAIAKYDLALKEWPDQPQVQQRAHELREAWKIKGPEHERARDFVFRRFLAARVDEIESLLPEARKALETLQEAGDKLTARQLFKSIGDHYRDLADVMESLAARNSQSDRQEAQKYAKLGESLDRLRSDVKEYLEGRRPAGRPPAEKAGQAKPGKGETKPPAREAEKAEGAKSKATSVPKKETPAEESKKKPNQPGGPKTPPPIGIDEEEEKPLKK